MLALVVIQLDFESFCEKLILKNIQSEIGFDTAYANLNKHNLVKG